MDGGEEEYELPDELAAALEALWKARVAGRPAGMAMDWDAMAVAER